jgi:hypothetical protein
VTARRVLWIERTAIALCSLALAVVLISLLSGYFTGHDPSAVSGGTEVGLKFVDQGNGLLAPGAPRPRYDSNPPTSGLHVPLPVIADEATLNDDQILDALAAGNVVILYATPAPPPHLASLARALAGPFSAALARAGQAVILGRRAGTKGLLALAWTRMLSVGSPSDPLLQQFVQQYLGHGAGSSHSGALPAS